MCLCWVGTLWDGYFFLSALCSPSCFTFIFIFSMSWQLFPQRVSVCIPMPAQLREDLEALPPWALWYKEKTILTFQSWKVTLFLRLSMLFTGTATPREAARRGWKKSSKMCLGTLGFPFWLVIGGISEDYYELMEFSAFRIPRWLQVVFEVFLFYSVCFSLEKEKNRVGLVRGMTETWG